MRKKRGDSKEPYFNKSDLIGFLFIGFVLLVGAFIGLNEVNNQLVDGDDDNINLMGELFQFFRSDVGNDVGRGDKSEITECVDYKDCKEYQDCFENKCLSQEGGQCFKDDDCMPARICDGTFCIVGCRIDDDCQKSCIFRGPNVIPSMICEHSFLFNRNTCQIGCRHDGNCPGYRPYCYQRFMADLDENELEWRGADTHKYCYECRYDGNCPNDKPYCIRAYCVECKDNADCPDDKSCEVGGFCKKLLKDIK